MKTFFLALLWLTAACTANEEPGSSPAQPAPAVPATSDAGTKTADAGSAHSANEAADSGAPDAGAHPVSAADGGTSAAAVNDAGSVSLATDAGSSAVDCAAAFFADLEPHMGNLVVIQGEADSEWANFEALSSSTGPVTPDEIRELSPEVGDTIVAEISPEDWSTYLDWQVENSLDPQAAQTTLDAVEAVFDDHLTDIIFVHFGEDWEDVEHYFFRVGRSACGEVLGLWTLVIWT